MRLLWCLLVLAACTQRNPAYCDSDSDCGGRACDVPTHTCSSLPSDAGMPDARGCSGDSQCQAPYPRCVDNICMQCVSPSDCMGGQICDSGTHQCRACSDDSACNVGGYPDGFCLDGGCVPPQMVAYATCWATSSTCPGDGSHASPFCNVQDAIAAGRPIVVLQPNFCVFGSMQIQDRRLQLWGRRMGIRPADGNDAIAISGSNADVDVREVNINGMGSLGKNGISVSSGATAKLRNVVVHDLPDLFSDGIKANAATAITIDRCLIYKNKGWGIYVQDTPSYTIENNFILQNGSNMTVSSGTGGVRLTTGAGGLTNVFVYNTISGNTNMLNVGSGVRCDVSATLVNSILPDNDATTMCTLDHTVAPAVPARDVRQIFVDVMRPENSLQRCGGYHVNPMGAQAGAVIGKGVAVSTIATDVDGEARAAPPTVGADEPVPCQ